MVSLADQVKLVQQCREENRVRGITIKQWCGEKGLSDKTYHNWKRRVNKEADEATAKNPRSQELSNGQKREWVSSDK